MAQRKKNVKFGFLFWVMFILLVLLLFFINKDNIKAVVEQTKAKEIFQNSKSEQSDEQSVSSEIQIQEEIERILEETPAEKKDTVQKKLETITITTTPITEQKKIASTEPKKQKTSKPESKTKSVIYFVTIDMDGKLSRISISRELKKSDSPMTDTLNALLKGPTTSELKKGYKTLVPSGTKLLSAYVKSNTAYINLNETFEFNQYGIEGYLAQLSQIVFTATEYPTVENVQILIDGKKKEFLGSEGVWIGSPLSRKSF